MALTWAGLANASKASALWLFPYMSRSESTLEPVWPAFLGWVGANTGRQALIKHVDLLFLMQYVLK